ncbi:MAG: choice-of-anchor A family protein [Geitlerinemataceae cyanobacterium]
MTLKHSLPRSASFASAALVALLIAPSAQAGSLSGAAQDYNLFLFDDWTQHGGDVEGRVAVGGNATLTGGVGIADRVASSNGSDDHFVVGGNLSYSGGGQVFGGNTVVGGTSSSVNYNCGGCSTQSGTPIDFASAEEYYQVLSDQLFALGETGTSTVTNDPWYPRLNMQGSGTGTHVFNVSLTNMKEIFLDASSASDLIVINVEDEIVDGGITLFKHIEAHADSNVWSNVVWNFNKATNIDLSNIQWRGTILAPDAHITLKQGNIEGQTVAKSATLANGNGEFHNYEFTGTLPTPPQPADPTPTEVPEPSLLLGMGAVAGAIRLSRRRQLQAA